MHTTPPSDICTIWTLNHKGSCLFCIWACVDFLYWTTNNLIIKHTLGFMQKWLYFFPYISHNYYTFSVEEVDASTSERPVKRGTGSGKASSSTTGQVESGREHRLHASFNMQNVQRGKKGVHTVRYTPQHVKGELLSFTDLIFFFTIIIGDS